MSDYLWDKKGDADEEVARLETLLGAFKHEPRPLSLPAEATPEPRAARLLPFVSRLRPGRLFAPAALATAALVVASVLAASLFLRAERPATHAVAEVGVNFPSGGQGVKDRKTQDETASVVGKVEGEKERVEKVRVMAESLPRPERRRKDVQLAAVPSRRQQQLPAVETAKAGGLTLEQMSTPKGASSLVENARLLTKEQLVYALRFTGAKLKGVQEKASRQ